MSTTSKMSKQLSNLIGLYLLGGIIAAVVLWIMLYSNQLNSITELGQEQEQVTQNNQELVELGEATEELRVNFAEVSQNREAILDLLPSSSQAENLLLLVAQYAVDSGVVMESFIPRQAVTETDLGFQQLEVQLSLTGKYDNLLNFFEKLENGGRYIDLVSYNFSSSASGVANPDLDLNIEFNAYYQLVDDTVSQAQDTSGSL